MEVLILVHGTGAAAADDRGASWWQRQGQLWQRASQEGLEVRAFQWNGENSESERRKAGHDLATELLAPHNAENTFHLVGHSHGGSVIWHALRELERVPGRVRSRILSWTTVGTPFLNYGLRRPILNLTLGAVFLSGVTLAWSAKTLSGVILEYARRDEPLFTSLWFAASALPLMVLAAALFCLWPFVRVCLRHRTYPKELTDAEGAERYLSLWSAQDEPTIGLGASGSFSLTLLREAYGDSADSTLPIKVRLPWAAATNQFVSNLVSRAIQGSTVRHMELRSASHYPHPTLAHASLPEEVDEALIQDADQHAAIFGKRMRELLMAGASASTGFSDFQQAAKRAMTFKEMVHTTYFDHPACQDLILYHLGRRSQTAGPVAIHPTLETFYAQRIQPIDAPLREGKGPLPSNRFSWVVIFALFAITVVFALTGFAQSALHRTALAPTTASYHAAQIAADTDNLAVALRGVHSPHDTREKNIMTGYVESLVRAGQLEPLVDAALRLPSQSLHSVFDSAGMRTVILAASHEQLMWIAHRAELLIALPPEPDTGQDYDRIPNAILLIGQLAAGGERFEEKVFSRIAAACRSDKLCVENLKLHAVHALLRNRGSRVPAHLLPLSGPQYVDNRNIAYNLASPISLANTEGNELFLQWAAANGYWGHAASYRSMAILDWNQFRQRVLQTLHSAPREVLRDVVRFVAESRWRATLPGKDIARLREAAKAAQFQEDDLVLRTLDENLDRLSDSAGVCNGPDWTSESRVPRDGQPCVVGHGIAPLQMPVGIGPPRDIDNVKAAKSLLGPAGLLARLRAHDINDTRYVLKSDPLDYLLPRLVSDVCARFKTKRGLSLPTEEDLSNLSDFFKQARLIGAAPPPVLQDWIEGSKNVRTMCKLSQEYEGEEHPVAVESAESTAALYTRVIADWLQTERPIYALQLVRDMQIGRVEDGAGVRWDAIQWLVKNHYYVEAVSGTSPKDGTLMRRVALFRLATCLQVHDQVSLAQRVAELAEDSAPLERRFGSPAEDVYLSEAQYWFSRSDWRAGMEVCRSCEPRMRLTFANAALPMLSASTTSAFKKMLTCAPYSEHVKVLVAEQEKAAKEPIPKCKDLRALPAASKPITVTCTLR